MNRNKLYYYRNRNKYRNYDFHNHRLKSFHVRKTHSPIKSVYLNPKCVRIGTYDPTPQLVAMKVEAIEFRNYVMNKKRSINRINFEISINLIHELRMSDERENSPIIIILPKYSYDVREVHTAFNIGNESDPIFGHIYDVNSKNDAFKWIIISLPQKFDNKTLNRIDYYRNSKGVKVNRLSHDETQKYNRMISKEPVVYYKDNESHGNLQKDLRPLLFDSKSGDVLLKVHQEVYTTHIHAHKCIISARSSVFKKILEKIKPVNGLYGYYNYVDINGFSEHVIREILRFMYTESCQDLDKHLIDVLKAAHYYKLNPLINICYDKIDENLNNDNVISTIIAAEKNNDVELKIKCIEYIRRNAIPIIRKLREGINSRNDDTDDDDSDNPFDDGTNDTNNVINIINIDTDDSENSDDGDNGFE